MKFLVSAGLRDAEGAFEHRRWRAAVEDAAALLDTEFSAIVPFGFEITQSYSFLKKPLHRMFVYLAAPGGRDEAAVADAFYHALLATLRTRHPVFADGLHGVVLPARSIVLSELGTTVLFVFVLTNTRSILDEWARFIVLAAPCIASSTLPEVGSFMENGAKRAFVFQLSVIFHHLFEVGRCTDGDLTRLLPLTQAPAPDLRTGKFAQSVMSPPTQRETEAFIEIVIPQAIRVQQYLLGVTTNRELVQARDLHGEQVLSAQLDRDRWRDAARVAAERYMAY